MKSWAEARPIEIRGLSYAVRLERPPGGRRAVVLLHGFAGSSDDWTTVAEELVDAGYAVAGIDLPGHGATEIPAEAHRFGMHETIRDLLAIAAALGLGVPHWIGYSMGGRVALHVGVGHPEAAASLILESTSPGIATVADRSQRRAEDDALASAIESRGIAWFVDSWEAVPLFETQRRLPRAILDAQRARRLANRPAGLAGSLRGLGQGAQEYIGGRLAALARPTLLLAGALDSKYSALGRRMAHDISGAELAVIPDAGHNIHLERPEAFRRALLDRLHKVEAALETPASLTA